MVGGAAERGGRPNVSDTLTTPIVQSSTYFFNDTADLIEFVVSQVHHDGAANGWWLRQG